MHVWRHSLLSESWPQSVILWRHTWYLAHKLYTHTVLFYRIGWQPYVRCDASTVELCCHMVSTRLRHTWLCCQRSGCRWLVRHLSALGWRRPFPSALSHPWRQRRRGEPGNKSAQHDVTAIAAICWMPPMKWYKTAYFVLSLKLSGYKVQQQRMKKDSRQRHQYAQTTRRDNEKLIKRTKQLVKNVILHETHKRTSNHGLRNTCFHE